MERPRPIELQKFIIELLFSAFSRLLRPSPGGFVDERIKHIDRCLRAMEKLENDPLMKERWKTLRKCLIWLLTRDGAYRVRAYVFLQMLCWEPGKWKLKRWENRYWRKAYITRRER